MIQKEVERCPCLAGWIEQFCAHPSENLELVVCAATYNAIAYIINRRLIMVYAISIHCILSQPGERTEWAVGYVRAKDVK